MRMNETLRTILDRRSERDFSPEPIPRDILETIVAMGAAAPSPLNNQPWRFAVIEKRACIEAIADAVEAKAASIEKVVDRSARQDYLDYRRNAVFFRSAAALVVVQLKSATGEAREHLWGVPGFFAEERRARGDILCIGAACQNMLLAAESLGLSSCQMLYPLAASETVRSLCAIEPPWEIMSFIALGMRKGERPAAPRRRAMDRIVKYIAEDR
jgi:nitroreductase